MKKQMWKETDGDIEHMTALTAHLTHDDNWESIESPLNVNVVTSYRIIIDASVLYRLDTNFGLK